MTAVQTIITLLADGRPRTTQELIAETGMSKKKISGVTSALLTDGRVLSTPVTYQLANAAATEVRRPGRKSAVQVREEMRLQNKERARAYRARKLERQNSEVKDVGVMPTVEQALAMRPALETFWGMACAA